MGEDENNSFSLSDVLKRLDLDPEDLTLPSTSSFVTESFGNDFETGEKRGSLEFPSKGSTIFSPIFVCFWGFLDKLCSLFLWEAVVEFDFRRGSVLTGAKRSSPVEEAKRVPFKPGVDFAEFSVRPGLFVETDVFDIPANKSSPLSSSSSNSDGFLFENDCFDFAVAELVKNELEF